MEKKALSLNQSNANNELNFKEFLKDYNNLREENDNDIYNKVNQKGYRPRPFRCKDCKFVTRSYKNRVHHRMKYNHRFYE